MKINLVSVNIVYCFIVFIHMILSSLLTDNILLLIYSNKDVLIDVSLIHIIVSINSNIKVIAILKLYLKHVS